MDPSEFTLRGPDDFVRLDRLCAGLSTEFFHWLQGDGGGALPPERATPLAHAADRYLRDFVVDCKETGPSDADPSLVRQYLGNWYVVCTLAPSHGEIDRIAEALRRLYAFLRERGLVSERTAGAVDAILGEPGFFHERLEAFWDLTPEKIGEWRAVDDYRSPRRHD